MNNYCFENSTFIIKDYDRVAPFSSFLPGIAGAKGIPLWCFYTNRGQGINSFGIHDKDHAIMEFNPANTAYENTSLKGFRTFLKVNGKVYEPFAGYEDDCSRTFFIRENSFLIEDLNRSTGIKTTVKYFLMPEESFGALIRRVTVTNTSGEDLSLEMLDGMAKLLPYGLLNSSYKAMSNLMRSWTDMHNIENHIPVFNMATSGEDKAEADTAVSREGIFYLSFTENGIIRPIYDNDAVFGPDTSLVTPVYFRDHSLEEIISYPQVYANRIPGVFTPCMTRLRAGETLAVNTLIGLAASGEEINRLALRITAPGYLDKKEAEAMTLVSRYTKDVQTHTSDPLFDQYIEQCYLDNFLRGGYPFVFPGKDGANKIIHLFSRKHGDPERDYNFFSTAGEFYSQGNGNFRDVNQNRRNDVFFHPEVGDFNVKTFFSLIQADGYNPLEIRSYTFSVLPGKEQELDALLSKASVSESDKAALEKLITDRFTPGRIVNGIFHKEIRLTMDEDAFWQALTGLCSQNIEAGHGEGYWSDHFTYNFDLVEDYLRIFPDKKEEFLYGNRTYRFYDSAVRVMPRSEKYVLTDKGVRQYGALVKDIKKAKREDFDEKGTNWLKNTDGTPVEVSLFSKMLFLAAIKFATLDPEGMGVEMEGGKPGWNDAMNGLPGLIGSGMAETLELERILHFLCAETAKCTETPECGNVGTPADSDTARRASYALPEEIAALILETSRLLADFQSGALTGFEYWDAVSTAREVYRDKVQYTMSGKTTVLTMEEVHSYLTMAHRKVLQGIQKAKKLGNGLMPTYLTYEAQDYTVRTDENGEPVLTHYGLPGVDVKHFVPVLLPAFLEGPARYLKTLSDPEEAKDLYHAVRESDLFDRKLQMYKTCVPIDHMGMDNGRIRAFTPGWQERESVFLHMSYKYQLGLLKAGLYDEFFEEMKHVMVPFLDPAVYGRSTLENSSFIASSRNPDPSTHGRGFVARLSGSTTEVLSMWSSMMAGEHPFTLEEGVLTFCLSPVLPGWMFDENGEVQFRMCSRTTIIYRNKTRRNTYGTDGVTVKDIQADGISYGTALRGEMARKLRLGQVKEIICELG